MESAGWSWALLLRVFPYSRIGYCGGRPVPARIRGGRIMKSTKSLSSHSRTVRTHTALTAAFVALAALAVQARHHHSSTNRSEEAGQFDYYVLSWSWAPTYCLTHADDRQ